MDENRGQFVGLRNWAVVFPEHDDAYRAPEDRSQCLAGCVEGHPGHKDGTLVTTGPVTTVDAESWEVATRSGRTYCLIGPPDEKYVAFLAANPELLDAKYQTELAKIVREAIGAERAMNQEVRGADVAFETSIENARGFEANCVVHATVDPDTAPTYSKEHGHQPGDIGGVELVAVFDHRGRDVVDSLSGPIRGRLEERAVEERDQEKRRARRPSVSQGVSR